MDAVNTLRAVLVGGAALAAIVAGAYGLWTTVAILAVGLLAHGLLWRYQRHERSKPGGLA